MTLDNLEIVEAQPMPRRRNEPIIGRMLRRREDGPDRLVAADVQLAFVGALLVEQVGAFAAGNLQYDLRPHAERSSAMTPLIPSPSSKSALAISNVSTARRVPSLAGRSASPLAETYPDIDWTTAFRKMGELESDAWDWTVEASALTVPTLLVFADADSITGSHIVAMYQVFGGFARDASIDGSLRPVSQLAILPGRNHYDIMETVEVARMVESFLSRTDA